MVTTASDRVQVRSQGELMHPGACALCGSGNHDDGYVDLGVYYDYEGQVYLCMTCVAQVIHTVDGLTVDEAEFLKDINNNLAQENARLTEELQVANERNAKWTDLISGLGHTNDSFNRVSDISFDDDDEVRSEGSQEPKNTEYGLVAIESKPAKPVEGKRPPKPSKPSATDSTKFEL